MRIAILCGATLDTFQQEVLKPILADNFIEVATALIDCRPKPSAKKRFLKNLKRGRGGYMIIMLFKSRFAKKRPSVPAMEFFNNNGVNCIETQQPYCDEIISQLEALHIDTLVMLGGFGIIKEPLLSLAPNGILSYHHGNMRKYRGQPVGFWELYHNEKEMGVTVQRLSAGIDKGTPIVEKTVPIEKSDTVSTLSKRALDSSTTMMHEALLRIQSPEYEPTQIDKYGPIYTLPNLRQYLLLQLKLLFRKLYLKQNKKSINFLQI